MQDVYARDVMRVTRGMRDAILHYAALAFSAGKAQNACFPPPKHGTWHLGTDANLAGASEEGKAVYVPVSYRDMCLFDSRVNRIFVTHCL